MTTYAEMMPEGHEEPPDPQPRWFMSYCYTLAKLNEPARFGCVVYEGEHPIIRVARWNREMDHRTHVLIWFRRLDGLDAPGVDLDAEAR